MYQNQSQQFITAQFDPYVNAMRLQNRKMFTPQPRNAIPYGKMIMCKFFNSKGGCRRIGCHYEHIAVRCAFFVSPTGCKTGDACRWLHVENDRLPFPKPGGGVTFTPPMIKPCPNQNCQNVCIGSQCRDCHRDARRAQMVQSDAAFDESESKNDAPESTTIVDRQIKVLISALTRIQRKNADKLFIALEEWKKNIEDNNIKE